jgi:hypothetical protein
MSRTRLFVRPFKSRLNLICVLLAGAGSMGLVLDFKPPKPVPTMSLEIVGAKKDAITRQVGSGWPITLRLSSNGELGIGRPIMPPVFPRFGEVGYIVFTNPDGCFSFGVANHCDSTDETYLEFTPDLDQPGLANPHGNHDRLVALTDFGDGGSPQVYTFNFDTHLNDLLVPYGPLVGGQDVIESRCSGPLYYALGPCVSDSDCDPSATCRQLPVNPDGYGYGADDDLPGLVLLSDTGVGRVLNQNFNRPRVLQERNLAGLLTSVAYELNDATSRTTVVAQLNVPHGQTYAFPVSTGGVFPAQVPRGLFTPVVLEDRCTGDPAACDGLGLHVFRIDGGPQVLMTDDDMLNLLNTTVVTVRAFVVNGTAPSILADLDGDGVVGAKDATLAGYQLLAGEQSIQFVGFYDGNLEVLPLFFDFDGNGDARGAFVAPGGPGDITKIPR